MIGIPSLKRNTIANFIGVGYTTLIGIIVFPLYLQYLGAEAFGLVGFFIALQAWMQLLDMGLSPLLSRQAAYTRGQRDNFLEFKKLQRSLEFIFFILALIVFLFFFSISEWITNHWLNITSLPPTEVALCITIMGAAIGIRFFSTLYRSGIQGFENQVQLNVANIIIVSLKFLGALLFLRFVTNDYIYYFIYQLIIGVIELLCMAAVFYSSMPKTRPVGIVFFWHSLKPLVPFAAGIAYTGGIWVLLTQLDKIVLSTILPLNQYGYFTLVSIISSGILSVTGPISQAILPRMTHLLSQGNEQDMLTLYKTSTQVMAIIMFPLTGIVSLFSTELLYAWSGDIRAAEWAGPILFWFALGNGIFAISAFQYYLQFAYGNLKMHVIYNSITASIQIPLIIYIAFEYGALGVAVTWFSLRLLTFIIWTPVVHHKFSPGIHRSWILKDIAPFFIITSLILLLVESINIDFSDLDQIQILFILGAIGLVMLTANVLVSTESRRLLHTIFKK